jgi:chorismate dehydratase
MLDHTDAAILIGDPALLALEERENRLERTREELVYHDLAQEWTTLTGLPFVSAVWGAAHGGPLEESVTEDFLLSRDHGLANIDALAAEWSNRLPIPEATIRTYLTTNIHYILDDDCIAGVKAFFREAASLGILPEYTLPIPA